MYVWGWVMIVLVSLWVSVIAFFWGLRSGQFSDQGRARYLALSEDIAAPPEAGSSRHRAEAYALLAVCILGAAALVAALALSVYWMKG